MNSSRERNRLWKCSHCNKILSTRILLRRHVATHNRLQQTVHKCSYCIETFTTRKALRIHEVGHPSADRHRVRIEQWGKGRHKGSGTGLWQCPFCSQTFLTRTLLRQHYANHSIEEKELARSRPNFTLFPRRCHVCNQLVRNIAVCLILLYSCHNKFGGR